jgi:formylglycine-generating enzyme required for sulfatase activity
VRGFISYAHNDLAMFKTFRCQVRRIEQAFPVDFWDDEQLRAGTMWNDNIRAAIDRAEVFILLISPSFVASRFIQDEELPAIRERGKKVGGIIFPVILMPCEWKDVAEPLQAIPASDRRPRPISEWPDKAYDVTRNAILTALRDHFTQRDGPRYPKMVSIPAGKCTMGVPQTEDPSATNARPLQCVNIAHPFLLGKYPVTRGEFAAFVEADDYDGDGCAWRNVEIPQDDHHPVVGIAPEDADAYAKWLSRTTNRPYRLPSEAEWEYAARAGSKRGRFWEDLRGDPARFAHFDASGTARVDERQPNPFGLHDMLGNVWEYCADVWHPNHAAAPLDVTPRTGSPSDRLRVMRGGCWQNSLRYIHAGIRSSVDFRQRKRPVHGFRVASSAF